MTISDYQAERHIEVRSISAPYFPFTRITFLLIGIGSALLFLLLFLLGEYSSDSTMQLFGRYVLVIFGPLIAFIMYLSFALYLFYEETLKNYFRTVFEYTLLGGFLAILLALSLNSRAFLLGGIIAFGVDLKIGMFFAVAVTTPLIEEAAKAVPIFFISRGLITKSGESEEFRIIKNAKLPMLMAVITGSMFNMLETYWFTWNLGYLFDIKDTEIWDLLSIQIVLRSINPLHFLTVMAFALGIAYSFFNTPQKMLLRQDYKPAYLGYLLAVAFHALWNGSLVLQDEETRTLTLLKQELPLLNVALIVAGVILFPMLLLRAVVFTEEICPTCKEWHLKPFDEESHKRRFVFGVPLKFSFLKRIKKDNFGYSCPSCNTKLTHGKCGNCEAANLYICQRCKAPVPVHSQSCWNCNLSLQVVFEDVFSYKTDKISILSQNITYILAGIYIPSSITMLILVGQNYNNAETDRSLESFSVIAMFLTLLGLNLLVIVQWLNNPQKLGLGFSLSRTLLAMIIFEIAIFFYAFALLLVLSKISIGLTLSGLFLFIQGTILFWFGVAVILNFRPLIHEIDSVVI